VAVVALRQLARTAGRLRKYKAEPCKFAVPQALVTNGVSTFNKGRVAKRMMLDITVKKLSDFPNETVDNFQKVIAALTRLCLRGRPARKHYKSGGITETPMKRKSLDVIENLALDFISLRAFDAAKPTRTTIPHLSPQSGELAR
jgi:hypothetical protein